MRKTSIGDGLKKILSYLWHQVIFPNLIWTAMIGVPSAIIYAYGIYKTISGLIKSGNVSGFYLTAAIVASVINTVILLGGITYAVYYIRHKKNVPDFPKLVFDYRVTSAEYELFFETREKIIQTQTVHLEALNDNLQEISHNMTWTGQTYHNSTLDPDCRCASLVDTKRTSAPYTVKILFNHPLRRGDHASYKFRTYVEDNSLSMMPYLSKIIKCQTEKLVIRVTVPKGMIKNPHLKVTTDSWQDIPLGASTPIPAKSVGHYDLYECSIENLELLRCYSICWEFS